MVTFSKVELHNLWIYIFIFFISSLLARSIFNKDNAILTSSGGIVMAIGIFTLDALPMLPFTTEFTSKLILIANTIIWMFLVFIHIRHIATQGLSFIEKNAVNQFGIGTWVASSAILAVLYMKYLPSLYFIVDALSMFAFCIWLVYLRIISVNLHSMLTHQFKLHTGIIFLATVSTQSIAIVMRALFGSLLPIQIYQLIIMLGISFYVIEILIIFKYYISSKPRHIISHWSGANSIAHGALSITGLSVLMTNSFNDFTVNYIWIFASFLFITIEGISSIKFIFNLISFGLKETTLDYDVSQWARLFTYGMYYTFTLTAIDHNVIHNDFANIVIQFGQYIIAALLVAESSIFVSRRTGLI